MSAKTNNIVTTLDQRVIDVVRQLDEEGNNTTYNVWERLREDYGYMLSHHIVRRIIRKLYKRELLP